MMKKKLVVLVALAVVAGLAFEALYVTDADAGKKKKPPPNYTFVLCVSLTCDGTSSADLLVDAAGNAWVQGGEGRDIYLGNGGGSYDVHIDESTSSDLYGGFRNGQFPSKIINDKGGVDRVDLSTNVSAYASTDFVLVKGDHDDDGAQDDLLLDEANFGSDDNMYVYNHFGSGRMEYIKFTDKTLSGANLPLS